MKRSTSLVTAEEALWRTGKGACVGDILANKAAKPVQVIRGEEFIDLAKFDGGVRKVNLAVNVIKFGPR